MLLERELERRADDRAQGWRTTRRSYGLYETESAVRIELELPGVSAERVRIDAFASRIVVRVDRRVTFVGDEDTLYMIDDRFSGFERSFELPESVDLCEASAYFSRDTLMIIVPKRRIRRSIPIEQR